MLPMLLPEILKPWGFGAPMWPLKSTYLFFKFVNQRPWSTRFMELFGFFWLIEPTLGPPVPGPKRHWLCESVRHHRHGGGGSKGMAPHTIERTHDLHHCAIFWNHSVGLSCFVVLWESSPAGVEHPILTEGVNYARFMHHSFTKLWCFSVNIGRHTIHWSLGIETCIPWAPQTYIFRGFYGK